MAMTRWDPYRELEDMSTRLSRIFGHDGEREQLRLTEWHPAVDIEEDDDAFHIKAELPAIEKKDVRVEVTNGVLTFAGERRREKEDKGKRFHRVERSYGSFQRSFTLPDNVDEDGVSAHFSDGVLDVTVPKTTKGKTEARTIDIQ